MVVYEILGDFKFLLGLSVPSGYTDPTQNYFYTKAFSLLSTHILCSWKQGWVSEDLF